MATLGEKAIESIPDKAWNLLSTLFNDKETLYEVIYLIVQNGHVAKQNDNPNQAEQLKIISWYQETIESLLTRAGLQGEGVFADVASDYFEDFAHYREREYKISSEEFIEIIKKLQSLFA